MTIKPNSFEAASPELLEQLGIQPFHDLENARDSLHPQTRLESVRAAGLQFREQMLGQGKARYYETIDLIRVPYPTKYGLLNVSTVRSQLMHILNRLYVLQFDSPTGLKTLLFSPSDVEGNRETPFFKKLDQMGPSFARNWMRNTFAPTMNTVEQALAGTGIKPEQVDYISYDHLHTQDVRKWLGSNGQAGYFPNAKLLVMEKEWRSTQALLPPQQTWYCPNGIEGVSPDKVVLLQSSVKLGEGVALVQTPGHTDGNHSLVAHTDEGLLVSSENGVCADSFAPQHSSIRGVRGYAKWTGMEVILNGNTLEGGLDQYISMVLEKTIAGPSIRNPNFSNVVTSSEMAGFWAFPGLKPSFSFGPLRFGQAVLGTHNE